MNSKCRDLGQTFVSRTLVSEMCMFLLIIFLATSINAVPEARGSIARFSSNTRFFRRLVFENSVCECGGADLCTHTTEVR